MDITMVAEIRVIRKRSSMAKTGGAELADGDDSSAPGLGSPDKYRRWLRRTA
jgi:hypothetical protein